MFYFNNNRDISVRSYAELGVGAGDNVLEVCDMLEPGSSIYIFDFDHVVRKVFEKIRSRFPGKFKVYPSGNSGKSRDSYCWGLMDLIIRNPGARLFDYVYIDGAHDFTIDGLAFYLVDILLKKGGYIEFDDYDWTFLNSPTVNPKKYHKTVEYYPKEQIAVPHIKLIIDNLVKTNSNYSEIVKNRVFRKA
jgi:hypothetical protein